MVRRRQRRRVRRPLPGRTTRSKTLEENLALYDLSEEIRGSETLSSLFGEHKDAEFFSALESSEQGCTFLEHYREFVRAHGHRGHEDRDFHYPRRLEDPSIDYRSFQLLLSREDSVSPVEQEEKLAERRQKTYEEVLRNLQRRDPILGPLKARAFTTLYEWAQRFLAIRDDERWAYEHSVMCVKLLCREVGRRCAERGILGDQEDFFLLTRDELFEMLDGRANVKLARAKATGRRRDFERALNRQFEHPTYLRDGKEVAVGPAEDSGGLHGTGWTSGTVTATARVVNRLSEIDRVRPGDILVCTSTDPGWTPVFTIIAGIVTETGGVLSHATCLSREYGLPSVQLTNARKLIPDGATVTVNGATGEISIVDDIGFEPADADANDTQRRDPSR